VTSSTKAYAAPIILVVMSPLSRNELLINCHLCARQAWLHQAAPDGGSCSRAIAVAAEGSGDSAPSDKEGVQVSMQQTPASQAQIVSMSKNVVLVCAQCHLAQQRFACVLCRCWRMHVFSKCALAIPLIVLLSLLSLGRLSW
jgi:hypothetical protein